MTTSNKTAAFKVTSSMDKAGIAKAIDLIQKRGATLDKDIQATALSIAAHIEKNREVTLAVKLYKAMPKGSRRLSLAHWLVKFAAVAINFDKDTKEEFPLVFNKDAKVDLEEGAKVAWFDAKKDKDLTDEFNPQAQLEAFQKRVQGWVKSGKIAAELVKGVLDVKIDYVPVHKDETLGDIAK